MNEKKKDIAEDRQAGMEESNISEVLRVHPMGNTGSYKPLKSDLKSASEVSFREN